MPKETVHQRVEAFIRDEALIAPGGEVTVLVSGGADSTCLWHVLRDLGYRVSALHVDHGLRGGESEADARFCRELLGAEVVDGRGGTTEDELRGSATASPRIASVPPATRSRIRSRRPLPARVERQREGDQDAARGRSRPTAALPLARRDARVLRGRGPSVPGGHIQRGHHPRSDPRRVAAAACAGSTRPPTRTSCARSSAARRSTGAGRVARLAGRLEARRPRRRVQAVREYERLWLERSPVPLEGEVRWGAVADRLDAARP